MAGSCLALAQAAIKGTPTVFAGHAVVNVQELAEQEKLHHSVSSHLATPVPEIRQANLQVPPEAPTTRTCRSPVLTYASPTASAYTNPQQAAEMSQAAARTWRPAPEMWRVIKQRSASAPATLRITGYVEGNPRRAVSQGEVTIRTSTDPVGAPIFYRDVPLMPAETEKGVIKPLAASAIPLIAWRLRNVGENNSHLLMEGIHSCANCHSMSRDGKAMTS